ncbi:hypothetical protein [Metasolibacillus sp.]|uniref:hypothetical protein n=1 Tax=Metasolibacillus sp. TaxID=2703680 RepID=UPI0025DF76C4|nr:hypothetical protein [Metasolibacillus sp.]MCT6926285.1 hypothetical protein [Metasolibacillus sp.]MCT6942523.1 hypothetical protein [Metasolibacillus sp.]
MLIPTNKISIASTSTTSSIYSDFTASLATLNWLEIESILKKIQKINFHSFEALNFKGQELESLNSLLEANLGILYNPTAQKIINNIVISSQRKHIKTGISLLEDIVKRKGKLRVYSGNYI